MEENKLDISAELENKLKHLPSNSAEVSSDNLLKTDVIACFLHDLRPTNVPTRHSFDLTNNEPVYQQEPRMETNNEIVRQELYMMLKARIVPM